MARSKSRFNDLYKVFKGGDSELLNEIGALCILFEDFRVEVAGLRKADPLISETPDIRKLHEMLYYVRRSLVALSEVKDRLQAICVNEEFRLTRHLIPKANMAAVIEARRFLNRNSILNSLRNHMGAHIDPEKTVQASIRYFGPNAISRIRWSDTQTDFALQLDFATHILEGAMGSHLPGGTPEFAIELKRFFEVMIEAFMHVQNATFVLIHAFLWDRFGTA